MYKNKAEDGKNNISGLHIKRYRLEFRPKISQRAFAEQMQVYGIDLDKNAIQRIEMGKRFVTDLELKAFAKVLGVSYAQLLDDKPLD